MKQRFFKRGAVTDDVKAYRKWLQVYITVLLCCSISTGYKRSKQVIYSWKRHRLR